MQTTTYGTAAPHITSGAWSNPPIRVMCHNTPIHLHHEKEQHHQRKHHHHSGNSIKRWIGFLGSRESWSPANLNHPLWRRSDSNRRPPACKAGALPLSYAPSGETRSQQLVAHQTHTDIINIHHSNRITLMINRAAMRYIAGRFSIPPEDLFCASHKINGPGRT